MHLWPYHLIVFIALGLWINSQNPLFFGLGMGLILIAFGVFRKTIQKPSSDNPIVSKGTNLNAIIDNIDDAVLLLNKKRTVIMVNQAAIVLWGNHLTGKDLSLILRDPRVLAAVDTVLKGSWKEEVEFTQPGPFERYFKLKVAMLEGEAAAILLISDITAIKRADLLRSDFVANASHELRTPLSALAGFIETLKGPAKDDSKAREKFLDIMQEQAIRMSRLVEDLLLLSQIELSEHSPPNQICDIKVVLKTVENTAQIAAGRRKVAIHWDIPPDLPKVLGDNSELGQIFQNLIDNAIKYGKEEGEVRVIADAIDKGPANMPEKVRNNPLRIRIIDQGLGIASEHLPRLTERFYRVDTARSRQMGGTGLGLAIVKHLVNRHRGALNIESEPGKGSSFTVYLPIYRP